MFRNADGGGLSVADRILANTGCILAVLENSLIASNAKQCAR
jgi:hypothetical protein